MLFSEEIVRQNIQPVKIIVSGTLSTMLFCQERVRPLITQ